MNTGKKSLFKKSKYNLIIPFEGCNAVYNTLQDSITLVGSMQKNQMSKSDISILHSQGIYINNEVDERLIFRYRANQQKYRSTRLHLFLTITGSCNCDCQYCFAKGCFPNRSMSELDISYIVTFTENQLRSRAMREIHIDFFGGEPFLCEDLYLKLMREFTKLSSRYGIVPYFQFYTNGTIIPRHGYEIFDEFEHVKLLITLDGLKDVHDKLRPLKDSHSCYDTIIKNLTSIREVNQHAVIRINYGKNSYLYVPRLLDELIKMGLTCFPIEFYPIQNMSNSSAEFKDAVGVKELPSINEYLWKEASKRNIPVSVRPVAANCYCSAFTDTMFVIDPDLYVYKCALLQCEKKYSIGNLKKQTKYQTDSVFYDWLTYDPSTEDRCKDCISLPVCAGGCGGSGIFRFGTQHHSNCYELSPLMLKQTIKTYISTYYQKHIATFIQNNVHVMILEKARYNEP